MKKLVFAAVAAIALTASVSFVSCDNKDKAAAPAADSTAVDSTSCCEDTTSACCDSTNAEVADSASVDSL